MDCDALSLRFFLPPILSCRLSRKYRYTLYCRIQASRSPHQWQRQSAYNYSKAYPFRNCRVSVVSHCLFPLSWLILLIFAQSASALQMPNK